LAALAQLTPNPVNFDSRTFSYGGHFTYHFQQLGLSRTLVPDQHTNATCGGEFCGEELGLFNPHALAKCSITAGSTAYIHMLRLKILRSGSVEEVLGVDCSHSGAGWIPQPRKFQTGPWPGPQSDSWTYRVTLHDTYGAAKDSNDAAL